MKYPLYLRNLLWGGFMAHNKNDDERAENMDYI
jgi:hypothetical protein